MLKMPALPHDHPNAASFSRELANAPTDPRLLLRFLRKLDRADAGADLDSFNRTLRRASRLDCAKRHKLHRLEKKRWRDWVEIHFPGSYETAHRHIWAARLQQKFADEGVPPLRNLQQARAIKPFLDDEKCLEVVAALSGSGELPAARSLRDKLSAMLHRPSCGNAPTRGARAEVTDILKRLSLLCSQNLDDALLASWLPTIDEIKNGLLADRPGPPIRRRHNMNGAEQETLAQYDLAL